MRVEKTPAPNEAENRLSLARQSQLLTEAEFIAETGKFLDASVKKDEFSGVVLIADNDKILFSKSYGQADKEKNVPNLSDTKFNLGSLIKSFTQVAIGQLIARKKLSPDDKIGKYLPDYPNKEAREKVTIRHLLTMTSGIGDIFGEKFTATPKGKIRTIKDYIPLFAEQST